MGKKTKYVPLEWSSRASDVPTASLQLRRSGIDDLRKAAAPTYPDMQRATQRAAIVGPEPPFMGPYASGDLLEYPVNPSELLADSEQMAKHRTYAPMESAKASNGQNKEGSVVQQLHDEETLTGKSQAIANIETIARPGAPFGSTSRFTTSAWTAHVLSGTESGLQAGFENLSLTTYHGAARARLVDTPQESLSRRPSAQSPPVPPVPASASRSPRRLTLSSNRLTPSPAKTPSGPCDDRPVGRRPVKVTPVPGKVYFMPDGRCFPESIIHNQKQQDGFFRHPIMVTEVEGNIVHLYAMTKIPPRAIRELNMALLLGSSTEDVGSNILRLAPESEPMMQESWINLEQRFCIEWKNLDDWAVHVQADQFDLGKLFRRVTQLEANQNRYIYKPLLRDMSTMQPGTILMLPNAPNTATFGAPIIVIENKYPHFRYLRVKRFADNVNFNPLAKRQRGSIPALSLGISKFPAVGHDGTPVMLLEHNSPAMREESYIEVQARPIAGQLDECRTWCWPPVKVSEQSMCVLQDYMAHVALRGRKPTPMYHGPVYPQYFQPPTEFVPGVQWHPHSTMQQPGYNMYTPPITPSYGPGGYVPSFGGQQHAHEGAGSGHNTYNRTT